MNAKQFGVHKIKTRTLFIMKRTWPILLVCMLLAGSPAQAQFVYSTNGNTITLTEYTGPGGAVTISNFVTTVGDMAFFYATSVTSVTIPNSVTSIGEFSFESCGLTNITIGGSVTNIGEFAFTECSGLRVINVEANNHDYASVAGILFNQDLSTLIQYPPGNRSFSYTVPDSVTRIGENAFGYCDNLEEVTISDSVTNIDNSAFEYCFGLIIVTIGNSVTRIGENAFGSCIYLYNITLPNSLTSIGDGAFIDCMSLTTVTIGNSVTNMGADAFIGCTRLTSVTIPGSVTSIAEGAFAGCSGLRAINVASNNPDYTSVGGVLFNEDQTVLIQFPAGNGASSYAIPGGVTNIFAEAFFDCTGLTNVTISNGVMSIGASAFYGCSSLTSVTLPGSGFSFGSVFVECGDLTNVVIANGTTNIQTGLFSDCVSLTGVTMPSSVTSIGDDAFYDCASLSSVTIPNSVTAIGKDAFAYCSLTNVIIPNSVISIGDGAFHDCAGLTGVTIPNSVTSIGSAPFAACFSLAIINVASNNPDYTSVAGVLFNQGQTMLVQFPPGNSATSYTIPSAVTSIGVGALAFCLNLASVTIDEGVTNIGNGAFYGCASLTVVTIPSNVASIEAGPFAACVSLTTINVATNNLEYISIDGVLFNRGRTALIQFPAGNGATSYTIPNSVASIGDYAFAYCSGLADVTIGDSVTNIGDSSFWSCSGLNGVKFSGNAPAANSDAFECDTNATAYYLPGTAGWAATFDGLPTALWTLPNPAILTTSGAQFGVQSNGFGFRVSWASNATVIVEAATNLAAPVWQPLQTNTIVATNGTYYFSDPEWSNYPGRFYRISSP
jgi:hypothetical protein